MTEILLTIFFISVLLFFLGSGIWVALSMIGVSAIGMMLFTSRPDGDAMATTIWGTSSSWTLTALPLFVWMGEILFRTKLSENLFKGLSPWMQKLPGGLIHVNVVGCALFAAISGSSAATTFMSQNDFVVVGKVENLDVTNEELSVTGQVINCTGDVIQQHPSQDSEQQLDYDTADDRDVMLGRDLDKNTELVG